MAGEWSPAKEGFVILFPAHGLVSFHGRVARHVTKRDSERNWLIAKKIFQRCDRSVLRWDDTDLENRRENRRALGAVSDAPARRFARAPQRIPTAETAGKPQSTPNGAASHWLREL